MTEERKYRQPPIAEVIFVVNFTRDSSWDNTYPGLLSKELANILPEKSSLAGFELEMGGTGGQPEFRPSLSDIVVFTNHERNIRVEPFKHQLVIRHTKPYTHWENFRVIIEKVLQSYYRISEGSTTQSLQLIYVNKVDFPAGTPGAPKVISINDYFQLEDSFKWLPKETERLGFISGVLIRPSSVKVLSFKPNDGDQLSIEVRAPAGALVAIFLQNSYFNPRINLKTAEEILMWADQAHSVLNWAFESLVTDKLRETFGEIKDA